VLAFVVGRTVAIEDRVRVEMLRNPSGVGPWLPPLRHCKCLAGHLRGSTVAGEHSVVRVNDATHGVDPFGLGRCEAIGEVQSIPLLSSGHRGELTKVSVAVAVEGEVTNASDDRNCIDPFLMKPEVGGEVQAVVVHLFYACGGSSVTCSREGLHDAHAHGSRPGAAGPTARRGAVSAHTFASRTGVGRTKNGSGIVTTACTARMRSMMLASVQPWSSAV
jgi:hypothetical protein